jgi:hypothetical protein
MPAFRKSTIKQIKRLSWVVIEKNHTAAWRHRYFQKVVGEEKKESLPMDILKEDMYR